MNYSTITVLMLAVLTMVVKCCCITIIRKFSFQATAQRDHNQGFENNMGGHGEGLRGGQGGYNGGGYNGGGYNGGGYNGGGYNGGHNHGGEGQRGRGEHGYQMNGGRGGQYGQRNEQYRGEQVIGWQRRVGQFIQFIIYVCHSRL